MPMIVSVHIPRTAGSSFRAYLRRHTQIKLKEDYGNPIMVPTFVRNGYAIVQRVRQTFSALPPGTDCIHGHFLPMKFGKWQSNKNVHFITWLRDPADRIRSQYDYSRQSDKRIDKSPFQNKVAKEAWSFEAFYEHDYMKNIYHKFFWRFPLKNFHFIGIVEHFESDFAHICKTYFQDENPPIIHGNRTDAVRLDDDTRSRIKALNQTDYGLYDQAVKQRYRRIQLPGVIHQFT